MLVVAAVLSAIGLLFYNGMLTQAPKEKVGSLFLTMIMVQLSVPALYQIAMSRQLTASKAAGIVSAAVAAILLAK